MSRATFLISMLLIPALVGTAQQAKQPPKTKGKPAGTNLPGMTTMTSFDKDHTVVGWLEIIPFESKLYHATRTLRVLVPANYFSPHNAGRSYPVLYMLAGPELFDQTGSEHASEWHMDETVEHLVGGFKIPPMFVVGVDPMGVSGSAGGSDEERKQSERFLLTEVMPFIAKHYRLAKGSRNDGIGGSMTSASTALSIALASPGTFGHLLMESPALAANNAWQAELRQAKMLPQKIYIGVGSKEGGDALKVAQEFESALRKKKMSAARAKLVIDEGGEANEAAWSSRLPEALLFLYGEGQK